MKDRKNEKSKDQINLDPEIIIGPQYLPISNI